MTKLLNASQARSVAEARWGRGGTKAYRTNRKGAFYFSCSGHGGFVIDARTLTPEEYSKLKEYEAPQSVTQWFDETGKQVAFFHPWRERSLKTYMRWEREAFEIFCFEEDCAYCLPVIFAGIKAEGMTDEAAKTSFWNWYDPENPAVQARNRDALARANQDPDLIVSARSMEAGRVQVWTADGKCHVVTGYEMARDAFGTPWLSLCASAEEMEAA